MGGASLGSIGNVIGRLFSGSGGMGGGSLLYILSCLAGLTGGVSAFLTARLVHRGLVHRQGVSPNQITAVSILSIAAWSLRLLLNEGRSLVQVLPHHMLPASLIYDAALHIGLILGGVFFLRSLKKPALAWSAVSLDAAMLLIFAFLRLGTFFSVVAQGGGDMGLRYLLAVLGAVAFAAYPLLVALLRNTLSQK